MNWSNLRSNFVKTFVLRFTNLLRDPFVKNLEPISKIYTLVSKRNSGISQIYFFPIVCNGLEVLMCTGLLTFHLSSFILVCLVFYEKAKCSQKVVLSEYFHFLLLYTSLHFRGSFVFFTSLHLLGTCSYFENEDFKTL